MAKATPVPVARIDRATGAVVNVEMALPSWITDNADDPRFLFVPYTPEEPAIIGLSYDPVAGFDQPAEPEPIP